MIKQGLKMRRVLLLITALFLLFSGTTNVWARENKAQAEHAFIASSSNESIVLQFNLQAVEQTRFQENNQTYGLFEFEDEGFTLENGRPELPAVSRVIVVPPEAGIEFEYRADQPRRLNVDAPPHLCNDEAQTTSLRDVAPIQGLYPPQCAEMSEPFVIRGVRMVKVTTYPVQYDAAQNVYLQRDNIETEIRFTNDDPVNPAQYPVRRNRSRQFMQFISDFALNGNTVGRDDPDRDAEPEYVGHYLVVVHESCLQYVVPLLEWRRKSGWKVDILRIPANQASNPQAIKQLIQERYTAYLEAGSDPFEYIFIIGDYAAYDPGMPAPAAQWSIYTDRGQSCWPSNTNHNDWWYAVLEGGNQGNQMADVAQTRWIAGSAETLRLFMHRTMSYETEPYMQNTAWFTRGAVFAQRWGGNYHVSLATNVRSVKHVLLSSGFNDVRVYENMDSHDSNGAQVGPFIRDQYNAGCNLILGRGENYFWRSHFDGVNANTVYPIDIDIAGHHEWTCWNMMRYNPNVNKGPVAATTGWGGQQTLPYSLIWLEAVNSFVKRDLTFGWTRFACLVNPTAYIPNFWGAYPQLTTDIAFYGDPGLQYWQGVPQRVEVERPEQMYPTDRLVEVAVSSEDNVVEGAQVTLYYPGNMPAANNANYATYEDFKMVTKKSDHDGVARFVLSDDWELDPRFPFYVTVTGRNILPNFNEIDIVEPESGVALLGWELHQIQGNNDGSVNPGESFNLALTGGNLGGNDLQNVTATVTSMSPWVEVGEDNIITFGQIPGGQEVTPEDVVEVNISPACPDAASRPITAPSLRVVFRSGDDTWETAVSLDPVAPNFEIHSIIGGNIIADGMDDLNLDLKNVGRLAAPAVHAQLVTLGMGVSVVDGERNYPAINPGGHARIDGNAFRIAGNRVVVPGSRYDMAVILQSEAGFIDTAFFKVQVSEPRQHAPQGPDNYGYICFDNTDTDWDMSPEFRWVEISLRDRDRDFDGIEMRFTGNSPNNIGESIAIALPFETQFYGRIYDTITVATNGFISMGNQSYVTNYQNWPMDRCIGGGSGMLSPLWDDLSMNNNSDVYVYYDEDGEGEDGVPRGPRFIIEWYKMRHRNGGNTDLTFQVILHDTEHNRTASGDQDLIFQYLEVANAQGRSDNWATASPFASVGISSPEGNSGINYTFNNVYPVTSAPLANQRALLFSTSPRYRAGDLFGRITDHANGNPVEGAVVTTQHGFTALSDAEGNWRIDDALAELTFYISCYKQGYNDSTIFDQFVAEDSVEQIDFDLLHPEFTPSTYRLFDRLDPELQSEQLLTLRNTGNGPLTWKVDRRLLGDSNAEPWEFRRTYHFGADVNDSRMQGVIFTGDEFYVSGSGNDEHIPRIYVFNREGEFIRSFEQPRVEGEDRGMRDLAWDGRLIWGAVSLRGNQVFGITTEGEVVHQWDGPYQPTTAITWDPEHQVLWLATTTNNPLPYTVDGQRADLPQVPRNNLRIYGLAYWPDDPDGKGLYIYHKERDTDRQTVHRANVETGEAPEFVTYLQPVEGGAPEGAFITNTFDVYSWVMMVLANLPPDSAGDRVDIWQVDARKDWFQLDLVRDDQRVEADSGVLQTGEQSEFVLRYNSTELPDTLFQGELYFYHNADSGVGHIYVDLDVIGPEPPPNFALLEPENEAALESTTVTFRWEAADDPNHGEQTTYVLTFNVNGQIREVQTEENFVEVDLGVLGLDVPWLGHNYGTWRVTAVSGEDRIECTEPFQFMMESPPSRFNLAFPPNDYVLRSFEVEFLWNLSVDPNPKDTVKYRFWLESGDDSVSLSQLQDTSLVVRLDTLGLLYDAAWPMTWWVEAISNKDSMECRQRFAMTFPPDGLTSPLEAPVEFSINSIHPNPFNAVTTIVFGADRAERMRLRVFDISGREVAVLFDGVPTPGWRQISWNAGRLPTGVYLLRLEAPGRVKIAKTAIVK